jgi:hypothetical protein
VNVTPTAARAVLTSLSEPALRVFVAACQCGQIAAAIALPVLDELEGLAERDRRGRWVVPTELGLATMIAAL